MEPPLCLRIANALVTFHRHLVPNRGACSMACSRTSLALADLSKEKVSDTGKDNWGSREKFRPSSVADACNSKSKVLQMFFLRAIPQARLMREPTGRE